MFVIPFLRSKCFGWYYIRKNIVLSPARRSPSAVRRHPAGAPGPASAHEADARRHLPRHAPAIPGPSPFCRLHRSSRSDATRILLLPLLGHNISVSLLLRPAEGAGAGSAAADRGGRARRRRGHRRWRTGANSSMWYEIEVLPWKGGQCGNNPDYERRAPPDAAAKRPSRAALSQSRVAALHFLMHFC